MQQAPSQRGEDIRVCRELDAMTRADLARRVGVHRSTIKRWEDGAIEPSQEHKLALADALGVNSRILFRSGT